MNLKTIFALPLFLLLISPVHAQSNHRLLMLTKNQLDERRERILQDNEFNRNEKGRRTLIHVNCLLLNGQPMELGLFSTRSVGRLTVVKGKPGTPEETPLPFYAYLRRNGKRLTNPFYPDAVLEIEIARLLVNGQAGDVLVIDPVNDEDYKAKRILKLID